MKLVPTLLFILTFAATLNAATANTEKSIPEGSRVYIAPMGGFESNLMAALNNKKVPVVVVGSRSTADFEVGGGAESQKANWMRIWVSGTWRTDEKASIVVKNLHTDVIVYAYEVNKWAAWHGSQSAAEACAKHMKHSIVRLPSEQLAQFAASPRVKTDSPTTSVTPGELSTTTPIPALGVFAGARAGGGAEITEVVRHGLAESSGLHIGDVINSVDGKDITTPTELAATMANRRPGSQIRLMYTFHTAILGDVPKEAVMIVKDQP